MSLRRFFIDHVIDEIANDGIFCARLCDGDLKHMRAARVTPGELVAVIDSTPDYFQCEVIEILDDGFVAKISSRGSLEREPFAIDLFQGLPKAGKLDEIVRHGTEIGINAFYPVEFKRSVSRINGRSSSKMERLGKIAKSAAEQSGRSAIPDVKDPMPFSQIPKMLEAYDLCVIFWEEALDCMTLHEATYAVRERIAKDIRCEIAVVIGPEGGIDPDEADILEVLPNARLCTLGPHILRTETAGVVGCALVSYELGGMGAGIAPVGPGGCA